MTESQPTETGVPALEMRGVTKRYPGVLANDHIDLDVRRGEIHALLGENGAGKSTLMNILYGLYHADEGEIVIKGTPVRLGSPSASRTARPSAERSSSTHRPIRRRSACHRSTTTKTC